jgi:stage V sporulation protein R
MSLIATRFLREGRQLPPDLEEERQRIAEVARGYGLDFFETIFEMCSYEEINMIAAYEGFPQRYPHWRWGMEFIRMQKGYEYGLQKIYEMVINTDPSYAYLMDCNLKVDQKLVMAHVFGHVDFFKNNDWFKHTNRKMLDQMATHAAQVRRAMDRHGVAEVERFIDMVLSLDNLIDPHAFHIVRHRPPSGVAAADETAEVPRIPVKSYLDRYVNPPEVLEAERRQMEEEAHRARFFPEEPVRDVLSFVIENAPLLPWQREVAAIVRDEAYYFAPQAQTKIMNEGWATFWHTRMMTRDLLDPSELVDYADHHSGTVHMVPGQLNPYKLGVELWRDLEERWNKGRFGKEWLECDSPRERAAWDTGAGLGLAKIFEARQTHNDVTFIDAFLTEDFCAEQGFFTTEYDKRSSRWLISSREFAAVKKQLLDMLGQRGNPRIYAVDANHKNRGELLLVHQHDGFDVQLKWAEQTLGNLARLWGRPVGLETVVEGKGLVLGHDGTSLSRQERTGR